MRALGPRPPQLICLCDAAASLRQPTRAQLSRRGGTPDTSQLRASPGPGPPVRRALPTLRPLWALTRGSPQGPHTVPSPPAHALLSTGSGSGGHLDCVLSELPLGQVTVSRTGQGSPVLPIPSPSLLPLPSVTCYEAASLTLSGVRVLTLRSFPRTSTVHFIKGAT